MELPKKRCQRCGEIFQLPKTNKGKAMELVMEYYPCPYCKYAKSVSFPKYETIGRCKDCSIPFAIVDHHGRGMCKRCHMRDLRHKKTNFDNI